MAPMTRARAAQPGNIPTALNATYYAQRASAALIISEATQISPQGQGYSFTPGLHSDDQVDGWRLVTKAVHDEGGLIFAQLWHVGRMSHASFHGGYPPVGPSALDSGARIWISQGGVGTMVPTTTPRSLTTDEIAAITEDYRIAAANAIRAGFDGVEIHAANGYLIDQFLRTTSNVRTDEYGGSVENRVRFGAEVVRAVVSTIGAEKVGIRISPQIKARNMGCPEIEDTVLSLVDTVEEIGIAYVHLAEADWDDAPVISTDFRVRLRQRFSGCLIVAGGYTPASANEILADGHADLVAFGRPFIANPDYPERIDSQAPLADFDATTLYGGNEQGYTDYPPLRPVPAVGRVGQAATA
ncbi:alkene reductase [Pseudoclavibacter terrae]